MEPCAASSASSSSSGVAETPRLFDTHCHLGYGERDGDADAPSAESLAERARACGVIGMVDVGIDVASSRACIARAGLGDGIYASAGLHPNSCANYAEEMDSIRALSSDPHCVALGESGLDLYWDAVPLEVQRQSLLAHIELGRRCGKTLILHCRDAFPELFETLAPHAPIDGILHCFTGDAEEARRCLDLGLRISFAGPLTYPRNKKLRRAAAFAPADRILIETDAPFLPPQRIRGERNEPAAVRDVAECLASVRDTSLHAIAETCTANSFDQFGLAAD